MKTEAALRDELATKLFLIEPGLTLIEKEHPLPNRIGAKGFIDILARDRFGNRVIMELKRSNQTARQSLHKIMKYVPLLESVINRLQRALFPKTRDCYNTGHEETSNHTQAMAR